MSRKVVLVSVCLVAASFAVGCAQASHSRAEAGTLDRPATHDGADPDSGSIEGGVRRAAKVIARAGSVWPGFDPRDQVFIAAVKPNGPVYLIGDPAPPSDYHWLEASLRIAVREGSPPDSLLAGLRLGVDWNGRKGIATVMTFSPSEAKLTAIGLVHEGFHTYQNRVHASEPNRFKPLGDPAFPDTSTDALTQLSLEGAYVGRALLAGEPATVRALARTAVALSMHRCAALGARECGRERSVEQIEGTAAYVQAGLFDASLGSRGASSWRDSLARALSPVRNIQRVERWYFYDSGHAWLLLLDRFGLAGWQRRVETSSPEDVLANTLGVTAPEADSLARVARQGHLWSEAQRNAGEVVRQEVARRDSLEHAFWDRPGVPIRVAFGPVSHLAFSQTQLPDGRLEQTYNFASNEVTIRGPSRPICCPGAMTIAPVAGRVAQVDGVPVRLDQAGAHAMGRMVLDLPELALRLEKGELPRIRGFGHDPSALRLFAYHRRLQ